MEIHIRALKQVLDHGLILEKANRVIEFNQEACLKPYIDMNKELWTKSKNNFDKDFINLIKNSVFQCSERL